MEEKQKGKLLDIEINEDAPSYTIQQVMDLLDVSRKTVHNLSDKGYIQAIELPYHTRFRKVYTQESVDRFIEIRDSYVPVINIADECGVPKQKIFNLMKVNNIPYEIDKIYYKRNTAIVTPELANEIKKLISTEEAALNTSRKSDFVYKGYALFQPFINQEGHTYRLSLFEENGKKSWGFYVNNAFLPFTEALRNKFEPVYTLADLPAIKSAYASFDCLSFDNNTKQFIDLLYQNVGVRNLYVQLKSNGKLEVYIKEVALKIEDEINFNVTETWLREALKEGDVSIQENVLYIYGSHKINSYYMNINTIKKIESLSAKLKLSSPEIIEKGIELLELQSSLEIDND
ncbi:helix-turn-helix domain-containing protein [Lysinibacillus fusiformis]|uniref:helix-turn-helix domain-containing protein n=1 Tax=Lysinibacillus fusiformis TaxID=28031 RepID=UPI001E59B7AB|nr:helix-turn-helix domain-containing protein [Lysinibacillus fusiformis]